MRNVLSAICAFVVVAISENLNGSEESDRIRASFDRIHSAQVRMSTRSTNTVSYAPPTLFKTDERQFTIDLLQKRMHLIAGSTLHSKGSSPRESFGEEHLRTPTSYLDISFKGADKEAITVTSKLKCDSSEFAATLSDTYLSAPLGFIPKQFGTARIDEILKSATLTTTDADLSFTAKHKEATIEARFDRESLLLKELKLQRPIDSQFLEHSYHYLVDETSQVAGIHFPAKFQITVEHAARMIKVVTAPPGIGAPVSNAKDELRPAMRIIRYVVIEKCQLNAPLQDADFAVQATIRDETRVTMLDARQNNYQWQNGAPVLLNGK